MREHRLSVLLRLGALAGSVQGTRRAYLLMAAAFALAAALSMMAASLAVRGIEHVVARDARNILAAENLDWAGVSTDGLLLFLSGEAPSEATRFRALSAVSTVVAAERVIDNVTVAPSMDVAAPRFSIELLRNGLDVSVIGLVPASLGTGDIIARIEAVDPEISAFDMLETASHPVPFGWEQAVRFGLDALTLIPVSKISISADQVEVTGLAQSERERNAIRDRLVRDRPRGLITSVSISAPRPVITPFTLRFVRDEDGARFDACSADTPESRNAILQAGRAAGASGVLECAVGLGSPTPRWQTGAIETIRAVAEMGAGSVTMSDTDITMIVPNEVPAEKFDRVVGALENGLPDVFSLQATRLPPGEESAGRAEDSLEFVAIRSAEGVVTLRGRLIDERLRDAVTALAQSEFGLGAVRMTARIDPDLPEGWPVRALLAIDALAELEHGQVRIRPDRIDIQGVSGDVSASDRISRVLVDRLGRGAVFNLDVAYDERYDPVAMQPTPARCERWIGEVLEDQQITFDPGSASVVAESAQVLDQIAEILTECGRLEIEVGGHTDSQGRLETNMRLSQQRAEAVVAGLMARGAMVSDFVAKGYGPEFPIADNATAGGREANRRIEFKLIGVSAEAARIERAGGDVADLEEIVPEPRDESGLEIVVTQGAGDSTRPAPRPER